MLTLSSSSHPEKAHVGPFLANLRDKMRSRWPEWTAIALYVLIVAYAIPYHEPWADEAQAWQLARSLSLSTLLLHYVRYEGSPGLWHAFLWLLNRVHVSYAGLHWICGAIASAGTAVLVLKSPFPRYLKLTLPFTYFLIFQYSIVARNYVFVPLILFIIASQWKSNPRSVALFLGLLANLALHAAVISGGLAVVYGIERIRDGDLRKPEHRRQMVLGLIILLSFYALAIWTAWPPHDLALARVRGESRSFISYSILSLVWGMCQPWLLSILFWIAIAICLYIRRSLRYLIPVLLFACLSGAVYANWWHVGMLIPLTVCVLWITWPAHNTSTSSFEWFCGPPLILMISTQILWSVYTIAYDHSKPYSPDLAAAQFLVPFVHDGSGIAVTYLDQPDGNQAYDSVGLLPYFDRNIFINLPAPFWSWSSNNPSEDLFAAALNSHPRIILAEIRRPHRSEMTGFMHPKIATLANAGYTLTNVFCGARPERLHIGQDSCHLIFTSTVSPQSMVVRTEDKTMPRLTAGATR